VVQEGPAIQQQEQKPRLGPDGQPITPSGTPGGPSRAASPPAPTLGGHAALAKRATSPKIPRPKTAPGSRATSPLANGTPSRATSPSTSRAGSPPAPGTAKRKADEVPTSPNSSGALPKPKKRKGGADVLQLTPEAIAEWLRNTPGATTKMFSAYFKQAIDLMPDRAKVAALVKQVASMKSGVLHLREDYAAPGSAAHLVPAA
jgi:transcription initiation factor TFIIF subunit alpha